MRPAPDRHQHLGCFRLPFRLAEDSSVENHGRVRPEHDRAVRDAGPRAPAEARRRADAILPANERVPTEEYQIGDRIRVLDKDLAEDFTEFTIEDIRAFHVHLRQPGGSLITYPNNLFLQRAVSILGVDKEYGGGSEDL